MSQMKLSCETHNIHTNQEMCMHSSFCATQYRVFRGQVKLNRKTNTRQRRHIHGETQYCSLRATQFRLLFLRWNSKVTLHTCTSTKKHAWLNSVVELPCNSVPTLAFIGNSVFKPPCNSGPTSMSQMKLSRETQKIHTNQATCMGKLSIAASVQLRADVQHLGATQAQNWLHGHKRRRMHGNLSIQASV